MTLSLIDTSAPRCETAVQLVTVWNRRERSIFGGLKSEGDLNTKRPLIIQGPQFGSACLQGSIAGYRAAWKIKGLKQVDKKIVAIDLKENLELLELNGVFASLFALIDFLLVTSWSACHLNV